MPTPTWLIASYQNFYIIRHETDSSGDHDRECKRLLGNSSRLADWKDLQDYYSSGRSMSALISGLNLKDEESGEGNSGGTVSRNGERYYNGSRHYFAHLHNHQPPGGFAVHDHIDNYLISLGSWSWDHGSVTICYK